MVAIVPNQSSIEGKIISIKQSPTIDDFSIMEILPTKIGGVKDSINLLKKPDNKTLQIHIANDVQKEHNLKEGTNLSAMIRKAPENLFVIPESVKVL